MTIQFITAAPASVIHKVGKVKLSLIVPSFIRGLIKYPARNAPTAPTMISTSNPNDEFVRMILPVMDPTIAPVMR